MTAVIAMSVYATLVGLLASIAVAAYEEVDDEEEE